MSLVSPIQFTCPCTPSAEKQTDFSRNFRIACIVAAILLLGISVLITDGILPLSIKVEWVTTTSALILFAIGCFTRCVDVKKTNPFHAGTNKEESKGTSFGGRPFVPDHRFDKAFALRREGKDDEVVEEIDRIFGGASSSTSTFNVDRLSELSFGGEAFAPEKEGPKNPHLVQAESLLKEGRRKEALKEVEKIYGDYETRNAFIFKVAEIYFHEGNLDEAFKTVQEVVSDYEKKGAMCIRIAKAYLARLGQQGIDREAAKKGAHKAIAELYSYREAKEELSIDLAIKHFEDKEYEKALQTLGEIYTKTDRTDQIYLSIAEACLEENRELALKALVEVKNKISRKEALLILLGKSYAKDGNTETFLKVFEEVKSNNKEKETLLSEYIKGCFDKENYQDAYKLIKKMGNAKACQAACDQLIDQVVKGNEASAKALFKEIPLQANEAEDAFFAKLAQTLFDCQKLELLKELIKVLFHYACTDVCFKKEKMISGVDFHKARVSKSFDAYDLVIKHFEARQAAEAFKIVRDEAQKFTLGWIN